VPISSHINLRFALRCAAAVALSLTLSLSCSPATERYGVDLSGRPISELGGPGIHFIVLVFAATDCPISNRYVPEIARLNKEFSSQGVRFWWVFPNPSDNAHVVVQHNKAFAIHENSLLDVSQTTTQRAHAAVTPEAAVFTADMREVYHGRIDDRYLDIGRERPQAENHDLESAISAALAGKSVPQPGGPSVGCSIVFLQK
jgi:hypothetical protein